MKKFLLFIVCLLFIFESNAQERYLDPIFTDVKVEYNFTYGLNATVLTVRDTNFKQAMPQPLKFDFYSPVGDNFAERPLILYFHSGNFLPYPLNSSVNGTRTDSTVVDICVRLAKMGYVVASMDYRLGWDPLNSLQAARTSGIINAAYRGVQDANTAIRYFKRTYVEQGNKFGIDTARITIWGQGTGGYIAINCSALDNYNKIPTATGGKFLISTPLGIVPMIFPQVNGDVEATSYGVVPTVPAGIGSLWGVPDGDTLCYPNHIGYSSEFHFGVNMGGAIGDSAWVDPGQQPMISFQTTNDPFAPYKHGLVLVPTNPPLSVVEVEGSYYVQKLSTEFGNNNVFANVAATFNDPYTTAANKLNDGYDGLYPILRANPFDSAPWDFWDPATNYNDTTGRKTNPDMSPEKARLFIDTIVNYFKPRACLTLDLGCNLSRFITGTKHLQASEIGLEIAPNPAQDFIQINTYTDFPIQFAQIMDISGRVYKNIDKINTNKLTITRSELKSGFYILKLKFKEGESFSKVVFK